VSMVSMTNSCDGISVGIGQVTWWTDDLNL